MNHTVRNFLAILCMVLTVPISLPAQESAAKIPPDQLDSLVAPIALYPDPLLAQTLAAATYPLEIVQLQQWLERNPNLKDKELADAAAQQPWDPTVQAMAGLPDVVKRLADDVQWTADLGNAFLTQQSDVMDAVQRMRKKAQDKGNLKSSNEVKIETKVIESKEVIIVEQANPEVIYVPSYNPVVVYGPPVYAYPPIYYPPVGYYAAGMAISWGVGVAMGAFWSGGWGWGCGWGRNDIDINVNNNFNRNFNRNSNINRSGQGNRGSRTGNKWQHNSQHRGGAPYSNRSTANKFGGMSRGDSLSSRQNNARQQLNRQSGNLQSSSRNRSSSNYRNPGGSNYRSSGSSRYRSPSGSSSYRSPSGGSRIGSRDMSRSYGSYSSRNAMGSGSRGGYRGSSARSSSSRGSRSMGSRGGGGGRRR
jgi:hypothetical protein